MKKHAQKQSLRLGAHTVRRLVGAQLELVAGGANERTKYNVVSCPCEMPPSDP